ncbi:MAG: hypothetical protein QM723_02265 [Myxococcaceae bacterium]
MKRILGAVVMVMVGAGCGLGAESEFRNGYPKPESVTMNVPGQAQGLTSAGTKKQGLEGQTADMYKFTRGVTSMVNGAGVVILSLVKTITDYPATKTDATHAIWGPWTDSLSPNTYKFTVTKNAKDDYSYVLEAKGKNEDDNKFRAILSGSHKVTSGRDFGSGTFLLDWDAAQTLPEHDSNVGTVSYDYSHTAVDAPVDIVAHFRQVKDNDSGKLIDVDYTYHTDPGAGGKFQFETAKDFVTTTAAFESMSVNSRWKEAGDGRSDVRLNGGDLTVEATASECWDSNFNSLFLGLSYDPQGGWGQANSCVFGDAQFSVVAPKP